jgi:hypothetical protein
MAVVQISRIQHRRGLEQDFPQLASAELGWSVDTRRLFIGNGLISEGAPEEGVTEILTVYTDIIALLKTYTYKGLAGGTTVITGASIMSPVTRTLQSKLDDVVSVKDFGVVGDGITDDTVAIQRALVNLWPTEQFNRAYSQHRTLLFPAGVYAVSDVIVVPPFVKLVGDGNYSTRIKQIDNTKDAVIRLCDSYYQTGINFGKPDAVFSYAPETTNYYISDILFERTTDADCVWIDGSSNVTFERCHFVGRKSLISAESNDNTPIVDTGSSNVRLRGISYNNLTPAKNIVFNNCTFKSAAVGIRIDNQTYGTTVIGSYFSYLHRGIAMGETSGGRDSPATTLYPRTVSVSGSYFDRIGSQAIQGYEDSGPVLSTGNTYENVGYNGNTYDELIADIYLFPVSAVLEFAVNGSSSVNDSFYRTYQNTQNRRYNMIGTVSNKGLSVIDDNGFSAIYLNGEEGLQMGRMVQTVGHTAVLNNATANATIVVNELNGTVRIDSPGTMTYVAQRDEDYRTGSFRVSWNDTLGVVLYDEEYTESSDIGLTFTAGFHEGGSHPPVEIFYTTTSTGVNIDLQYSIKYHTANNSPR